MLDALKRLFGDDRDPAAEDARAGAVAAAALLVEAALADGIYAQIEAQVIREAVATSFSLDAEAAARLVEEAEALAERAVDHHRFTTIVKHAPMAERVALIEALWRVAFADGEESPFEEAFVRRIANLIHVPPREARLARQRVKDALDSARD